MEASRGLPGSPGHSQGYRFTDRAFTFQKLGLNPEEPLLRLATVSNQ